ncbi:MAG: hypothetical protein ACM67O_02670 [Clostridiales bacterium]
MVERFLINKKDNIRVKSNAGMYCQQFDNFKNVADFFEFAAKLMRR